MILKIEGKLKKFFILSIPIKGKIEINLPLESLAKIFLKNKLFSILSQFQFTGKVKIDNEEFEFENGEQIN